MYKCLQGSPIKGHSILLFFTKENNAGARGFFVNPVGNGSLKKLTSCRSLMCCYVKQGLT